MVSMDDMDRARDRIGDALARLAELNNNYFGLGGAAGDADREQYESLLRIAWELETILEEAGE